jgi:putative heme-binding domain-containing protein
MRIAALLVSAWSLSTMPLCAQDHGVTPETIERGQQIYLAGCTNCHGPDGDSVSGVNLASNQFRKARTDADLIDIVRKGIPGTPMPPGNYSDPQAQALVAYLHSLANAPRAGPTAVNAGDSARGKALFEGKGQCLNCHRLGGNGAFNGPDLTDIGRTRRRADLETSLLDPNAEIRQDNRTLRATFRDGTSVAGNLLNQDTYSLQLIDAHGKLISLQKAKLRDFEILATSPMPSYKDRFNAQEIADVVSYLGTLR